MAIEWDVHDIGLPALQKHGDPFPKAALDSIRRNKVGLKGPLTTELGTGMRSVNVALRKEFDLYANLRPAKTYPGVRAPVGSRPSQVTSPSRHTMTRKGSTPINE